MSQDFCVCLGWHDTPGHRGWPPAVCGRVTRLGAGRPDRV